MNEIIIKVLKMLEDNGYKAYVVGGYPRDLYMGKESTDYDICTSAKPKEIKNVFKEYKTSSDQYGCVVLYIDKHRFEITTFRKDVVYFNNRFPISLKYVKDLKTDLQRRDFKMNTICLNSNGEYIDLLNGKEDIDNKIIKVVGNSDKKIKEDALRILRAIRFATILDFELDNDLKRSIKVYGHLLKKLSFERKKEELDKIFASNNALKGIEIIKEMNLSNYLDIDISNIKKIDSVLAYWVQVNPNGYKFKKCEKEQIDKTKELLNLDILNNYNLYRYGLYISLLAGEIKGIDKRIITQQYNELAIKDKKDIVITPLEICNILNKEPGEFLKDIISDIEIKIVNGKLSNDKDKLIEYIKNNF